jgi:hypothetical protein
MRAKSTHIKSIVKKCAPAKIENYSKHAQPPTTCIIRFPQAQPRPFHGDIIIACDKPIRYFHRNKLRTDEQTLLNSYLFA